MNLKDQKRALRKTLVERILSLDLDSRQAQQRELTSEFATIPGYQSAESVLLYVSAFPEEIDTSSMLTQTLDRGKRLICPRVDRTTRRLRLHRVEHPALDLSTGTLGIREPAEHCQEVLPENVDWVLVPGLGFDARCFRLGRGAGHYDRLLPSLRPEVPCWALAFDCQWIETLPVEPHDVPLDGVLSPRRIARRNNRD